MKQLDVENWKQQDPTLAPFVRLSASDGSVRKLTGDEWASEILAVELADAVPTEVHRLFEVARGTLVYGYFYYPLYTLGTEQLFRVAQSAVTEKCRQLGKSFGGHYFMKRVDYLIDQGKIPPRDRQKWDALCHLRNMTSHPDGQTILPPGIAIGELRSIALQVNGLFEE